jgi:hypothetical protein
LSVGSALDGGVIVDNGLITADYLTPRPLITAGGAGILGVKGESGYSQKGSKKQDLFHSILPPAFESPHSKSQYK